MPALESHVRRRRRPLRARTGQRRPVVHRVPWSGDLRAHGGDPAAGTRATGLLAGAHGCNRGGAGRTAGQRGFSRVPLVLGLRPWRDRVRRRDDARVPRSNGSALADPVPQQRPQRRRGVPVDRDRQPRVLDGRGCRHGHPGAGHPRSAGTAWRMRRGRARRPARRAAAGTLRAGRPVPRRGGGDLPVFRSGSPDDRSHVGTSTRSLPASRPARRPRPPSLRRGVRPLFVDRRIRQAISYAINKDAIIQGILGYGKPATGPYKPGTWAQNPDVKKYPTIRSRPGRFWPRQAGRTRTATASWTGAASPLPLRSSQTRGMKSAKTAEIIQKQLAEVGMQVKIRTLEWAAFVNEFINKCFDEQSSVGRSPWTPTSTTSGIPARRSPAS